ncbi:hypothetical protein M758_6G079400 [Ceratodon purpureus]|nr:hypothetical protein M758_6G079400 [Ceratodon purpureus]
MRKGGSTEAKGLPTLCWLIKIGRVLRIRKVPKNNKNHNLDQVKKDSKPVLSVDERKLWREWPSMAMATTPAALSHVYAADIMQPLLGESCVDAGLPVFLTTGFLEAVNEDVVANQPEWRSKDAVMDLTAGVALLIADHASFPTVRGQVNDLPPTITVELKPKWGCLPEAATISGENNVKLHVSRFTLFQQLKFQQGKIKSVSKYSPLDLFSGNEEGILKALVDLFETPQNNIRVFLEGEEVFGGPVDGGSTDELVTSLEKKLAGVSVAPEGERVPEFQRLVASALNKSKVLDQLLRVQKLDAYDIEGAILAYKKFMEMTDDADADGVATTLSRSETRVENLALEPDGEHKKRDMAWIESLSWDESRRVVRNFLISATAKDCGLMITLRPLNNSHGTPFPVRSASIVTCPTTGQQYICKVALLDLDTKRLKKMPFYHSVDQEIVDTYKAHRAQ